MSEKLRNPFRMRASEKIESDANFLRLFSPHIIEGLSIIYDKGKLWGNIVFIHGSPGAGKTSLLRIFEPQYLTTLFTRRTQEYNDLFNNLRKIGIYSDDNVEVLGVLHTCTRNYEVLEDLDISDGQKSRIFFSLINSRLIISTLRGILKLKNLPFPEGLKVIQFFDKNYNNYFKKIEIPCSGLELYNWAIQLEKNIYSLVDSFLPFENTGIEGHDELFSFEVLKPENLTIDGEPICKRILFMLDDAHKLSSTQRELMQKFLIEKRSNASIWISERKEAQSAQESIGSIRNRDFEELNVEEFWQDKPSRFERILTSIASKRAQMSSENVNSFQENLDDNWDNDFINSSLLKAIPSYEENLKKLAASFPKFLDWVNYSIQYSSSPYKKAILLKSCEILIHRNIDKLQLDLGFPLLKEEFLAIREPSIDEAARFFISREHTLPYYYGWPNLIKLSNNNIEQFLSFSADLFEEMLSNNLTGKSLTLNPTNQERIIKSIIDNKWKDLPRVIPYSRLVIKFLEQFSALARRETYKPNAPIVQGVTGIAVSSVRMKTLFEEPNWERDDRYMPLVNVLSTCVANNLLEPRIVMQGQKGQRHQVFYLNRWLCMKFNLPLAYGGWKSIKTDELINWIKV